MVSKYEWRRSMTAETLPSLTLTSRGGAARAIKRSLKEIGGTPLSAANLPLGLVKMENFSLCVPALFYLTLNFALMSVATDYLPIWASLEPHFRTLRAPPQSSQIKLRATSTKWRYDKHRSAHSGAGFGWAFDAALCSSSPSYHSWWCSFKI